MEEVVYKIEFNTPNDWDDMILAKNKETAKEIKDFLEKRWFKNIRIKEVEVEDWSDGMK